MVGMNQRRIFAHRQFGIEHGGERLVFDLDQLQRILGDVHGIGDYRGHPFTGIARHAGRQRPPDHIGKLECLMKRCRMRRQFLTGDNGVDTFQCKGLARINGNDAGPGIGARRHGHMFCSPWFHVLDIIAGARDKAFIFLDPPFAGNMEKIASRRATHPTVPFKLSAARRTASMICVYPVHRHKFPPMASLISSSLGSGVD